MHLKQSIIIAFCLTTILVAGWEIYWRSTGRTPSINDDKSLWAVERFKVSSATENDVIILGSSRAYFDIQIKTWENEIGKAPIQLASTGSSPLPTFHDIVENTKFKGTVLVGVTPGLLFSTTYPEAFPWARAQSKVDYYANRTYTQKLNHILSIPLQENLVLMSGDEEEWFDDIDLKSLLRSIQIGNRISGPKMPPFRNFGETSIPRNMRMMQKTIQDTAFANSIIRVWHFFGKTAPPPDKDSTMAFFLKDIETFKNRGGNLILVRCPSSGGLRMGENKGLPRKDFWDELISKAQVANYHFEDYPQFKKLICPEESHLSSKDADYFTKELARLLISDGIISKQP
ncbi:hypothetical protein [Gaetbulibacter saemankumensis]|uniref:hypothetical protein n=1 Tax=Gaetbulibacter saemankumensis TaxID=311208 RepID=UPI000408ADE0|nr:hypothetical protein [Gaetbulibacter saemankumensis]